MGGVVTDLDGRANLPGLFAVGEAACTGVHGADCLVSNSLLEGVVFAARIGRALAGDGVGSAWGSGPRAGSGPGGSGPGAGSGPVDNPAHPRLGVGYAPPPGDPAPDGAGEARPGTAGTARPGGAVPGGPGGVRARVRRVMMDRVGVVRSGEGLTEAVGELGRLAAELGDQGPQGFEVANLVQLGRAVAELAARREESRGGHWRSDHPATVAAWRVRQTLTRTPEGGLGTGLLAVPAAEEVGR